MSQHSWVQGSSAVTERSPEPEPFAVAAGLLWNDRYLLIPLCLVLGVSAALDLLLNSLGRSNWMAIVAVDRALQIGVVTWIVLRWRRHLQTIQGSSPNVLRLTARIAAVSIASSVLLAMPVLGLAVNLGGSSSLLFVALGVMGVIWCLRVYFYFAVVGILGLPITLGLAHAVRISKADGMAALRSLVVPCGITMLLTALLTIPSPDGRSVIWMTAASSAECIFWILSTYLALGYALTAINEGDWRAAGLTPYRRERLSTLQMQGGKTLPKYLRPKFGFAMCAAALCCMAANLARQLSEPPAVNVVVKNVIVADYSLKVELEVEDRSYKFRGFYPVAFSVKTKTGFGVSNSLTAVSASPDGGEMVTSLVSEDGAARTLFLTFSSGKTAAALRGLDNIWLWYQFQPLVAITPQMLQQQQLAPEASA
jgi:hypothetical protein